MRVLQDAPRVPLAGGAELVDGVFIARPNRFIVEARLGTGELVRTHCADRGRLLWLQPGTPLLIGVKDAAGRKTGFQVAAAWMHGAWASLDTHLPNRLTEAALRAGAIPSFTGYPVIRRESRCGLSRFDFRLERGEEVCYLEVKSVGAVRNGIGLFPDAPTTRGTRHLQELALLARSGVRSALIFIAQHAAAGSVMVDLDIDPAFDEALSRAVWAGVEIHAFCCPIGRDGISLSHTIPYLPSYGAPVESPVGAASRDAAAPNHEQ